MKLCAVVGARPNFVKAAPVVREAEQRGLRVRLVHTGQHYDAAMSDAFFRDLEIREPDDWLGVGSGTHARQTADVMTAVESLLEQERPRLVLVFGDVNSTLAAALAAAKLGVPVGHVESGLRSFDRRMPEEINRVLTDHLCDLLFVTEQSGVDNLAREGITGLLVGNTMIDTLLATLPRARALPVERSTEPYAVLTLHRPSNVDDEDALAGLLHALASLDHPIVFPVHPRTAQRLGTLPSNIAVVPPMGYVEFLAVLDGARLALTDSGGIQEETTVLGVPCVTIRENTERPVTVTHGTNVLAGVDPDAVVQAAERQWMLGRRDVTIPLWDGHAAGRVLDAIERWAASVSPT